MSALETRRLGRTEMTPKALGLGCGHLGDENGTDAEAVATVREAIEQGIDLVDTSPYYGVSEERVGLALADGWRDRVYLQTKVGSHPRYLRDFSREATTWSLENSLRQLRTDYIDSVLIHGPRYDIEAPLGHCLDVMVEWKAKGRIGHIGIGVRQPEYHRRAIETGEIDLILTYLDYTLLSQSAAQTIIPLALEADVGIFIGSPLGGSMLAGPEPRIEGDVVETYGQELVPATIGGPTDPAAVNVAHRMWQWCEERGLSIRDLAMQFAMHAPVNGNGIVLCGPANRQQFRESYASASTPVSEGTWSEFETEFGVRV